MRACETLCGAHISSDFRPKPLECCVFIGQFQWWFVLIKPLMFINLECVVCFWVHSHCTCKHTFAWCKNDSLGGFVHFSAKSLCFLSQYIIHCRVFILIIGVIDEPGTRCNGMIRRVVDIVIWAALFSEKQNTKSCVYRYLTCKIKRIYCVFVYDWHIFDFVYNSKNGLCTSRILLHKLCSKIRPGTLRRMVFSLSIKNE